MSQPAVAPPNPATTPQPAPPGLPGAPGATAATPGAGATASGGVLAGTPAGTIDETLLRGEIARAGESIPQTLRRLRLAAAVLAMLAGLVTSAIMVGGWQVGRAAASDTEQLVRVEAIRADLLRADAIATNAFLVGGLEPPAQRAEYDQALGEATTTIAHAAQAQPADAEVLAALNSAVLSYAGTVEQARATNRQGLPVGAAYLRSASTQLRSTVLPLVDQLSTYNDQRARGDMDGRFPWVVLLPGLIALAALVLVQRWASTTFRRVINPGLAVASVLLLGIVVAGGVAEWTGDTRGQQTAAGSYAKLVQASQARAAANDARANEGLMLIARGSGAAYATQWDQNAAVVTDRLAQLGDAGLTDAWTAYAGQHAAVVKADAAGRWDAAVAGATGTSGETAATAFTTADTRFKAAVTTYSEQATGTLGTGSLVGLLLAVGVFLAGLAAARAAWGGLSARLQEYEA